MKNNIGYYFLIPSIILLAFTSIYPLFYSFIYSFYNWNWGEQKDFVGLQNYIFLLTNEEFWVVIRNTFLFASFACFFEVSLGIILALYIDRIKVGSTIIRTILLIPLMVSGIIVSMMSKVIFNNLFGVIPFYLKKIGLKSSFFGSSDAAMPTLIGVDVWWQTAFVFIIILAGLQSIPQEPIESAKIEGATEWQITRYIRLPMIRSLVFLVIIFRSIDTLKIFDLVWGITGGGPGISTEVVQTYSYRLAFGFLQMSKSMTVMILFSSVVICLTFIYSLIEKRNND
jgi:multiple sugar transport system permease protein|tara:strand:+ start:1236 stop:2087 length:852 start_codon:yes stop_codon:yes gene_type:complete